MNKLLLTLGFAVLFILSACGPRISTQLYKKHSELNYKEEVTVIKSSQPLPQDAQVIGTVNVGDSGFSVKCNYELVLDKAKLEARKIGGNVLRITRYTPPDLMSSCHRIKADIIRVEDLSCFEDISETKEEVLLDVDYAILNVYRYSGAGSLVSYDLYLGDSVICRVRNNFKTTLHIKKDGLNSLWAKTESKSEVPINVKMGKQYYLKCSIKMGAFVGRPNIELVDNSIGETEFSSFNAKNK